MQTHANTTDRAQHFVLVVGSPESSHFAELLGPLTEADMWAVVASRHRALPRTVQPGHTISTNKAALAA